MAPFDEFGHLVAVAIQISKATPQSSVTTYRAFANGFVFRFAPYTRPFSILCCFLPPAAGGKPGLPLPLEVEGRPRFPPASSSRPLFPPVSDSVRLCVRLSGTPSPADSDTDPNRLRFFFFVLLLGGRSWISEVQRSSGDPICSPNSRIPQSGERLRLLFRLPLPVFSLCLANRTERGVLSCVTSSTDMLFVSPDDFVLRPKSGLKTFASLLPLPLPLRTEMLGDSGRAVPAAMGTVPESESWLRSDWAGVCSADDDDGAL